MIKNIELFIHKINHIHSLFSNNNLTNKFDLTDEITRSYLEPYLLRYRLQLHESINDYLMTTNLPDLTFYYRVQSTEKLVQRINTYYSKDNLDSLQHTFSDIFACRIILNHSQLDSLLDKRSYLEQNEGLFSVKETTKNGYTAIFLLFQPKDSFCLPWELQIWNIDHINTNISNHKAFLKNTLQ